MIYINKNNYCKASLLKQKYPSFFRGCKSIRDIIKKKNIPEDEYIFMLFNKTKGWYSSNSRRAFLLLKDTWVSLNIPNYGQITNESKQTLLSVCLHDDKYVLVDDLITRAPLYSIGVRSGKDLIKKKNINDKLWTYARQFDGVWKVSDGKSRKYDKVFI